jgi:small-conductance mechanosensitive channel
MNDLKDWLFPAATLPVAVRQQLVGTFVALVLLAAARLLVLRVLYRGSRDPRVLYRWRKTVTYTTFVLAFMVVGRIWSTGFSSLSTFLGLLTAGLAIALQDPIVNLAGWLFILWRRPFAVGDRIQIGDHQGDVIDIRVFQSTILEIGNWVHADQSTGRVIHIPNGKVFRETQANFTQAFAYIWNEIPVLVTFESDWRRAKGLLEEIAVRHALHLSAAAEEEIRAAARQFMIFYTKLSPAVYTSVADSGVMLTVRYLCDPRQRRGTSQAIWEDVLDTFAACGDIDLAYPTYRYYDNVSEGKRAGHAFSTGRLMTSACLSVILLAPAPVIATPADASAEPVGSPASTPASGPARRRAHRPSLSPEIVRIQREARQQAVDLQSAVSVAQASGHVHLIIDVYGHFE